MEPQAVEKTTENNNIPHVSTAVWLITLLLVSIPVINVVMLFVWAFSKSTNPSKSAWAKAVLIYSGILIVLFIAILILFGSTVLAFLGSGPDMIDKPAY